MQAGLQNSHLTKEQTMRKGLTPPPQLTRGSAGAL